MPAGVTDSSIAEGKALFEAPTSNCTRCHGADGTGGTRGPNLMDSVWVHSNGMPAGIAHTITEGVPKDSIKGNFQFPMAPKGRATITDAQVNAIASYLWSASHKH
jgi:mono/diheme cytochrome c family protein